MDRAAARGIAGLKEPVDHIIRPLLPWRSQDGAITECGYDASKVKAITREAYSDRLKELGQQRAAMFTCMTCADTCRRWASWDTDPRAAIGREVEWEYGASYYRSRTDRGQRLKDELTAIALLIATYRSEFVELVETVRRRRDWLEKKAAAAKKPKPREPGLF
jgi:hypothetical protein